MINAQRLTLLRKLERLTQAEFAARLGVTQALVSGIERGHKVLTDDLIVRASHEFKVPISFFDQAVDLPLGTATFRKSSKASARDASYIEALFIEAARAFASVSLASGYRSAELPMTRSVEDAANEIRAMAGISPDAPIRNVTRVAERLGVGVVAQLASDDFTGAHEGMSCPSAANNRPLIATVGRPEAGDRYRFSIAHELGHLIFDQDLPEPIRSTRSPEEKRAHAFAGALLLPANVARKSISESLTLQSYLQIKAEFGISVSAAINRAHYLDLISDHRRRSLQIQISSAGWRKSEPVTVTHERPALFKQAFDRVYGSTFSGSRKLGISPELLERWLPTPTPTRASLGEVIDFVSSVRNRSNLHGS